MKSYFTPVEFPELPQETAPEPPPENPPPNADQIKAEMAEYHSAVMAILMAIRAGESPISPPVLLKGSGLLGTIERMRQFPSKQSIEEFLSIARQDINARFRTECEVLLKSRYTARVGTASIEKFPQLRRILFGQ